MAELKRHEYAAPRVTGEPVEVSDGVFVIPDRRVSLVPNVGIVVGGDAALVIDTGLGPRNGRYVLEQATRLAGKRPLHLAVTQMDPGHGFGIQAFKGAATIIFSAAQRDRLHQYAPAYHEAFRKLGLGDAVEREFEGLQLVEPDIVHDGHLTLDLGGVEAVLDAWGPAHTTDDQTVLVKLAFPVGALFVAAGFSPPSRCSLSASVIPGGAESSPLSAGGAKSRDMLLSLPNSAAS